MALLVSIKISFLKKDHHNDLDELQNRYMTTIICSGKKMDNLSLRILLGLPKLSDFIIKLELMMYSARSKSHDNDFTNFIKNNYDETHKL